MSIFIIHYDRANGQIIDLREFAGSKRADAQKERLDLEIDISQRAADEEVVLLEAPTLQDLKRTHRRYFESLERMGSWTEKAAG